MSGHIRLSSILKFLCICLLLTLSTQFSAASAVEIHIIAHPSVPLNELTANDLKRFYTGKIQSWEDGRNVILTYQKNNDISRRFFGLYIHKSPIQFANYWRNRIFTGRAHALPKQFSNEALLLRYVSKTKGAIGYVSSEQKLQGVKVLLIK